MNVLALKMLSWYKKVLLYDVTTFGAHMLRDRKDRLCYSSCKEWILMWWYNYAKIQFQLNFESEDLVFLHTNFRI